MVAVADVKSLFPETAAASDATIAQWLEVAEGRHNADAFGSKSDFALKALTAHLVVLSLRRVAGGTGTQAAIRSRTVDRVSTTYAVPEPTGNSFGDAALASTGPGQLYLDTREGIFADRVV
ncbi:MAG TPA: DUF4054 domain-containing protein [Thermoanaerobaculia bacterium]|nr:DUF4054 domain-containing protein [Thermoanaerobaculia bacterium]